MILALSGTERSAVKSMGADKRFDCGLRPPLSAIINEVTSERT
jgi:hypothetical protein